ncbi:uncharacterized protein LOC142240076 [Haematobia irritans]|uniref:uncharacterized protein LOC142240076 n=1 Tax=Haematobia irritans TaxID=7368 RepID=UPI003F4FBD84
MTHNLNLGPVISDAQFFKDTFLDLPDKFKYAHLNFQSIRPSRYNNKLCELKSMLVGSNIDVFAISETWLKAIVSNRSLSIPGYEIIRSDRLYRVGGGVAIYLRDGLKYNVVFRSSEYGTCESLCVELHLRSTIFLFCVAYLPHGDIEAFRSCHSSIFERYTHILVVGDFNCNIFRDTDSLAMRDVCGGMGFSIIHNSLPTHFDVAHNSTSLIDFCLTNVPHLWRFSSQGQCPGISHHSMIFGSIDIPVVHGASSIQYRDYRNVDWNGIFQYLVGYDFSLLYLTCDVDYQLSIIDSVLRDLFEFVPIVTKRIIPRNDDWLKSDSIAHARSLRDIAYLELRRNPSTENKALYRMYRNRAKAVIRNERRKFFDAKFSQMDGTQIWKTLHSFGCINDDVVVPDIDVNSVNDYFCDSQPAYIGLPITTDLVSSRGMFQFSCIFEVDLLKALAKVRSGAMWKTARVVPVPKKGDSFEFSNLRPISILPAMSKIVEHIINEQILDYLDTNRLLGSFQYGFRRGFSTTTHLLHLTDLIRETFNSSDVGVLVGIDLSRAFDTICHMTLVDKLRNKFRFSVTAAKLMSSYLHDRSQFVAIGSRESSVRHVCGGVPQGSVLGPLLFIMYMNDVTDSIVSHECNFFAYADDIHLFFRSSDMSRLEANVNMTLGNLAAWLSSNGLNINVSKSNAILFNDHGRGCIRICIGTTPVSFVNEMRCLGVVIDHKLEFGTHIGGILSRVAFKLRRLYCVDAYMPRYIRQRVAMALLMPHVNYCIEITSATSGLHLSRIENAVKSIVRYVYGLRKYDHVSAYVIKESTASYSTYFIFAL